MHGNKTFQLFTNTIINNMKKFIRFAFNVSQRKLIVPQIITVEPFDDRFKVSSQTYEFLITRKPPSDQIYTHQASTPAAVLKKPAIHILPDSLPELNKRQKIAAVTRQFDQQYEDAFKKCTLPKQIFHLERRIKYDIRNKLNFIGCLSSKYKHLLTFKSYFDIMAQKTQSQYQKNGVKVDLIEATIYPKGKVWMPTSTRYLTHFAQLIKQFAPQKNVSALDIGCGSGILSFVFAKTNKKSKVYAFDKNQDAVQTTNVNAASLKMSNNIEAFQFDVLEQQKFQLKTLEYKVPKLYECIFVNPPWIPASKLQGQSAIGDGVYDKNSKMLINSLKLSKRLLEKQGKIILIYSDLAEILGLSEKSIEILTKQMGLKIQLRQQLPLYEQMPKKSALQQFKNKAKILTYVLNHV